MITLTSDARTIMVLLKIVKPPFTGPGGNPLGMGEKRPLDKKIAVKGASQYVFTKQTINHPTCCYRTFKDISYQNRFIGSDARYHLVRYYQRITESHTKENSSYSENNKCSHTGNY